MVEKNSYYIENIKDTLYGPLWARGVYSQIFPEILKDPLAVKIFEKIDIKFNMDEIFKERTEFQALWWLVRAKNLDDLIKSFIKNNPKATIVNIGAGLDTAFFRVDNNEMIWYDLDLPSVIKFRKKFIPKSSRNKTVSKSIFDYSWFEDIEFIEDKGILFVAGGFFIFFEKEKVINLINSLANQFHGGHLIFDLASTYQLKDANRRHKNWGSKITYSFGLNDPTNEIPRLCNNITILDCFTPFSRIPLNSNWSFTTKKLIDIIEKTNFGYIIHLKFS